MDTKKTILIGYDDSKVLNEVLSIISTISDFIFSTVSISGTEEIYKTVKSLNPDLIILCYKKNLPIITDTNFNFNKIEVPILCLIQKDECESKYCSKNCIVFTHAYKHISNSDFFSYRIKSIFQLKNTETNNNSSSTFTEAAIQNRNTINSRSLSHYVMELDQKVEVLQKIKTRISYLYPNVNDTIRKELMSIVNSIKNVSNDTKLWDDFKIYFEDSNPNFLLTLANKHPSLSSNDLKYCCYIKMNMSNNDITNLLGINQNSVRTHKYRLKKKLILKKEEDIITYLRTVS